MDAENGAKFRRLWNGNTADYPSHSEADLALCSLLAFYTDVPQQIDRLFRKSDLYREKWDHDGDDYGQRTIDKALADRTEFYDPDGGDEGTLPAEPGTDVDRDNESNVTLCPAEVMAWAGLGEDGDVADLTDRQKAACVWELASRPTSFTSACVATLARCGATTMASGRPKASVRFVTPRGRHSGR